MAPLNQGAKMRKSTEKRTEKKITKKVTRKPTKKVEKKTAKQQRPAPWPKPSQKVYTCIYCGKTGIMILPPVKCKNCDTIKSYVIRTDLKVPESYEG